MASDRRRNKRKKLMSIYKTTMKIKADHPEANISECIKTSVQIHNTVENKNPKINYNESPSKE